MLLVIVIIIHNDFSYDITINNNRKNSYDNIESYSYSCIIRSGGNNININVNNNGRGNRSTADQYNNC